MSNIRFILPLLLLAIAPALFAVEVAHWAPNAADPNRQMVQFNGQLRSWDWAGGVKVFDTDNNREVTFARDNVISVSRNQRDRSAELERAINNRNIAALTQISTGGRDDIEKEEATWQIAHIRSTAGGAAGLAALRQYNTSYPRGNFALEARMRLAAMLAGVKDAPQANRQEATRLLDEAAALGGEVARAGGNLLAGEHALLHESNGAAVEKLAIAVASAKQVRHLEFMIRALVAHGRALSGAGKNDEAKRALTEALGVAFESEYNLANMRKARGEAQVALAQIAGNTREGYDAWIAASCWFSGTPSEAFCLLAALDIAATMAETDPENWETRHKELRGTIERTYRQELQAHERRKAAAAGGR